MKNNEGACAVRLLQYNRKQGEVFSATEQALIISVTMTMQVGNCQIIKEGGTLTVRH